MYLQDARGRQFQLTPFNIPKSAPDKVFLVDNAPVHVRSTDNRAWSHPDHVLYYAYVVIPSVGFVGYITSDYNKPFTDGMGFVLRQGKANRPDPQRIPRSSES
jgi:hypothetical protein